MRPLDAVKGRRANADFLSILIVPRIAAAAVSRPRQLHDTDIARHGCKGGGAYVKIETRMSTGVVGAAAALNVNALTNATASQ